MNDTAARHQAETEAGIEVLVFTLGGEEYAVDILMVQEIRGYSDVTRIAGMPDYIKGVTNLRGVIVPIIDLRVKLDLDKAVFDQGTVVIVLTIGTRVVGMVVDGVSDVLAMTPDQIKPAPHFGAGLPADYIRGLGSIDDRMLILLEVQQLLLEQDFALAEEVEVEDLADC